MSNTPRRPVTPPHGSAKATDVEAQLPSVDCLGLAQSGRGWVVVRVSIKGDRVLDKEVLSAAPEPRGIALRRLQYENLKAWAKPEADA